MSLWFGTILLLIIYLSIPTFSAQVATNYLLKFKPPFQQILLIIFVTVILSGLIDLGFKLASHDNSQFNHNNFFIPLISFFAIKLILFAKYIKHPESGAIGEKAALKVIALTLVPELLLSIGLALIFMLVFNGTH
jgi:hypothetical protein